MCYIKSRYTETSNGYVKLYLSNGKVVEEHRWLMEQHLGHKLTTNEVVHHINGDPQNNLLGNLEVKLRGEHATKHGTTGRTVVQLVCSFCKRKFTREVRFVNHKKESGQKDFYCNRQCMGKAFGRRRPKKSRVSSSAVE